MPIASNNATNWGAPVNFSPPANMNIAARPICVSHSATRATRPRGMAGVSLAVMAVEKRGVMIWFLPVYGYDQILREDAIPMGGAQDGTFTCLGYMEGNAVRK